MQILRYKLGIFSLVLAHALVFAQTSTSNATLTGNPTFQKNCAKCHGKTAEGRHFGGPSLISSKVSSASADDLRNMIASGKGRMPEFAGKLTTEEIDTLVQQIEALNKK